MAYGPLHDRFIFEDQRQGVVGNVARSLSAEFREPGGDVAAQDFSKSQVVGDIPDLHQSPKKEPEAEVVQHPRLKRQLYS
jgi:hypothetical protein